MATRTYDVERMQTGEQSALIGGLARAFYDDPLFNFFVPDPISQTKGLLAFMGASVVDATPFGEIWIARTAGKFACGAVWLPPGAYPRGTRRDLMTNLRGLPTFVRSGRRLAGAVRLLNALDKAHHAIDEPHYYLAILGTDPLYQRSGAGSAALRPVLDRCDREGVTAYLETQKEENLAYYARHAFELIEKVDVGGVPPVWTLSRKPRAS
jgi:GNAT superfamily N-acetyltransferase